MAHFGLQKRDFSDIEDDNLDSILSGIVVDFSRCGERMLREILKGKIIKVQRLRLRGAILRIYFAGTKERKTGRLHRRNQVGTQRSERDLVDYGLEGNIDASNLMDNGRPIFEPMNIAINYQRIIRTDYNRTEKPHHNREKAHHNEEKAHHNKEKAHHNREKAHHNKEKAHYNREKAHHDKERSTIRQ
ncbi:unnamed protein product [Mytilus edulis]|uniref:Uncharacterized protein n=1 Tax=Mytilus edulis TaxID=6550 RepID=A0A8S3UUE4_MYTED|nr:unnamed protein product [Mytilus edulis]